MGGSDGEIVVASLSDPVRFALIFDRHVAAVRRFLVRRVGATAADDAVAEVFRIGFERRAAFRPEAGSCLPWLYGIALNVARREHRSNGRRWAALAQLEARRDVIDPLIEAMARVDAQAARSELLDALWSLTEDEREVLLLVAWDELSPTEAAAVLSIPPETARTRLRRARQHVRAQLERFGEYEGTTADAN